MTHPDRSCRPGPGLLAWLIVLVVLIPRPTASGQPSRALPAGKLPDDIRLQPLKDLDGYFPFTPPKTPEEWRLRAARVRLQILVSQGLWPMPTSTPLNSVVYGRVDRDEYTVENVFFESAPGFFVTGNLYRPKGRTGRVPGVLFAHGHWANARLSESSDDELLREISTGEERFEEGGRSRFQSLCVQLARMGCVVWQWDMLGNSDSQQLSMELVHRFKTQRPEMNTTENWGLFSPQAEAHLQSAMGLQTWNSVRSLDFLLSLPEVDPERIAMTGASGGGTQTMILAAIDPRIRLSFPAVMVSTAMQGGCTCENACLLRIDTGNVEFAGLFAPGPQGMTTANDWTKELATKGFPELKQLYTLLGVPDEVMLHRGEHFPHNYNAVSRTAFYSWLNRHFKLGFKEPVIERDYRRLTPTELTVWDAQHVKPFGGDDFERKLLRWFTDDAEKQLGELAKSPHKFAQVVGDAMDIVVGRNLAEVGRVAWEMKGEEDRGGYFERVGLLRNLTYHEELPAIFLDPKKWNKTTVVWIDEAGKAGLFSEGAPLRPKPEIQLLLDGGASVVGVDLLYQGESALEGGPVTQTRRVKNPREAAAYTFGYNRALFAQRVHDIVTLVHFVKGSDRKPQVLGLVGMGTAGPWVATARAQASEAIDRAVIDTRGFRFGKVMDIQSIDFLPGGAKYGDVPTLLALGAPGKLWLTGEGKQAPPAVLARYQSPAVRKNLVYQDSRRKTRASPVKWLLAKERK